MTENEVKETREWLQDFIRMFCCNFDDLETRGFNECVMFLKELEQYRAIGTVDELEAMKKGTLSAMELADIWCVLENLKKYSAIGTIEEFKALKEKAEPKKAIFDNEDGWEAYICPSCGKTVGEHQNYCWNCGQAFEI